MRWNYFHPGTGKWGFAMENRAKRRLALSIAVTVAFAAFIVKPLYACDSMTGASMVWPLTRYPLIRSRPPRRRPSR